MEDTNNLTTVIRSKKKLKNLNHISEGQNNCILGVLMFILYLEDEILRVQRSHLF